MKAASINELKKAMNSLTPENNRAVPPFGPVQKENKELLTYLLLELPDGRIKKKCKGGNIRRI